MKLLMQHSMKLLIQHSMKLLIQHSMKLLMQHSMKLIEFLAQSRHPFTQSLLLWSKPCS